MKLRSRSSAQARDTYKLCSLLLGYPGDALLEARAELVSAAEGVGGGALVPFGRWWANEDPLALQAHYVETFDLHKRCGLYLTFYGEGDRRQRGLALLRLKRLYRAAGLPMEGSELPDYLPVMLEFAACAPDGRGEIVLREHRPALELLRANLHEQDTPYAQVLDAVSGTLGEPTVADRARAVKLAAGGPPSELVGLEPLVPPTLTAPMEAPQ